MMQPNKVFHSEALALLRRLQDDSIDLIYTDPPRDHGMFWDKPEPGNHAILMDHLRFIRQHAVEMKRVLKASGTLYLHIGGRRVHNIKVVVDEIFGEGCYVGEIIWAYGKSHDSSWLEHDNIIVYSKHSGPVPTDTTLLSGIHSVMFQTEQGMNDADHTYPGQKSLELASKIVRMSTRIGDVVLDPFAGSGTLGVAALQNERRFILGDSSPWAQEVMFERFLGKNVEYDKI